MTTGREITITAAAAAAAVLLLVTVEPVLGFAVLAGAVVVGFAGPRGRVGSAAVVFVLGTLICWLALVRRDQVLAFAGALVVGASAAVVVRSGRWPVPRRGAAAGGAAAGTSRDTWDALDRGEDPTA